MAQHAMKNKFSAPHSSTPMNISSNVKHSRKKDAAYVPASCHCPPLSTLYATSHIGGHQPATPYEHIVPATRELNAMLRAQLEALFPRSTPLSVILLHVTQIEHLTRLSHAGIQQHSRLHHGPSSFIDQILINLRRVIRSDDQLVLDDGTGFALVLPDVNQQGSYLMLERIYESINLLQAETVTPPLTRQTNVLLGSGSYPQQGASIEHLLYASGRLARSLTLRPALRTNDGDHPLAPATQHALNTHMVPPSSNPLPVPFMKLPGELPARLKRLIPGALAREIRSVAVGRDHQRLTVAMTDPTNNEYIARLQAITAMTIFPVSCREDELELLLSKLH